MQPLHWATASKPALGRRVVNNKLNDLLKAHLAVVALLESGLISVSTRMQLEVLREQLERDIAAIKDRDPAKLAAD